MRVKNILRRASEENKMIDINRALCIDDKKMTVSLNEQAVVLTPAEFRLLSFFNKHPEQVFSREQLMTHIYQDSRVVTDRTIDSHIKNIRRKLQAVSADSECIKSIYGVGYKLEI